MNIVYNNWKVYSEVDFVENNIEKINCGISVNFNVIENNEVVSTFTRDITVINLNSQTGVQMDMQRNEEVMTFVNTVLNINTP